MGFLKENKLLIGIVVVVLVVVAGMAAIFNWQKTHLPLDISPEGVKAKCIEDITDMTDDELINEVDSLKYPGEEISPGETRMNYGHKNIVNYLICRSVNDENYSRAKSYIEGVNIQEENRKVSLSRLNETYNEENMNFLELLANGNLDDNCPDKLSNLCLEKAKNILGVNEKVEEDCNNICEIAKNSSEDEYLESKLLNLITPSDVIFYPESIIDDSNKIISPEWIYAIIYRYKKEEGILKTCEVFEGDQKNECLSYANDIIDRIKKTEGDCSSIREDLSQVICDIVDDK